MLTHICLENFKSFKQRAELQLAPITLLYGPNSSGKSSIIQAMMYGYEVIANDWLDVDQCSLSPIDLGGFWNVLNNQAEQKEITLGFGYTLDDNPAASKAQKEFGKMLIEALESYEYSADATVTSPSGGGGQNWGYAEFTLAWSGQLKKPYVSKLSIYLQSGAFPRHGVISSPCDKQHHVLDVISNPSRQQVYITNINFEHELFSYTTEEDVEQHPLSTLLEEMEAVSDPDTGNLCVYLNSMNHNAKPRLGKALELELMGDRLEEIASEQGGLMFSSDKNDSQKYQQLEAEQREINDNLNFTTELFSQLIITPLHHIALTLEHMAHIGPWRDIPKRNFMPSRSRNSQRWYKGIAGWDEIYQCPTSQFDTVSGWMKRLKTGYTLTREDIAPKSSISSVVHLQDTSGSSCKPADVGVGISQVFPIVVAACSPHVGTVAIEQPELHIHPALQVELGDLFSIMAVVSSKLDKKRDYEEYILGHMGPPGCKFLLETHSEHLILRLLKRIRQSSDGEELEEVQILTNDDVSIIYLNPSERGVIAKKIRIDDEGEFLDRWPRGFFAERREELL